tara:strand:+ start:1930 stop:2988 length:1059 start_codon:yes stop_codon:yes gene_type:complete
MKKNKIKELEKELIEANQILDHKEKKLSRIETKIKSIRKYDWDPEIVFTVFCSFIGLIIGIVYAFDGYESLEISFPLILVCGGVVVFYTLATINDRKEIKKNKLDLSTLTKEVQSQKLIIENIEKKLNTKRDNTLQSLIVELTSELDLNSDNTIDVIQHENEFYNLLKSNQSIILEMEKSENRDFTKQFVKLSNFLVEKEKNLQSIFKRISDIEEYENFEAFKSNFINQIQFYNILRLNSLQMISSFIDDDRITFYMIYEKLDKLGVWNTNFENQFLIKMDLLNSNINRLISEIKDMSQSINSSISELIFITQENTDSVTNKLKEIGSKLDTSNLLNTINTYQNYKTNQRLK